VRLDEKVASLLSADREFDVQGTIVRLGTNLGYYNGPVDGAQNDDLSLAVARFQGDEKLAVSGDIDDDTRDALRQRHDGA